MKVWVKKKVISKILHIESILDNKNEVDDDLIIKIQNQIIKYGTICEEYANTGNIVSLFEYAVEYCYQYFIQKKEIFLQRIKNNINLARLELENIGEEKMEILFLPYKAVLWNAMKSVYESVLYSQECDVRLMPIPYVDKGIFEEEKCEQEYFKNLIGYIDYNEYSIKECAPDIIFIHNPYDHYNTATTVKKEFYSSELIKYTKHLVYIPYDVIKGDNIDDFMCIMPGVKNAWKVFVQSEKIRRKYLKYNEQNRIISVGTPKFDFLNEKVEKYGIPFEWERKIQNRAVILCNIHIGRVLNRVHEEIQMIKDVMNYFESKNIVLIYRPHPLLQEILKNRSYEEYKYYMQILEQHSKSSNIILDDTFELERAVIRSDACIGDRGSLEMYFGVMGKPMYFFGGKVCFHRKEIWEYLPCYQIEVKNDKIWFFLNNQYNLLCEFDLLSKQCKCITCITEESEKKHLVDSVVKKGNKIILIPAESDYLRIYNMENNSVKRYELKSKFDNRYKYQRGECIDRNDIVYLMPVCADYIIAINIEKEEILYLEIDHIVLQKLGIYDDPFFMSRGIIKDGNVYLPAQYKPYLLKCHDNITDYYKIGNEIDGFTSCIFDGKYFWLIATARAELIRWNEENNECIVFSNFPAGFMGKGEPLFIQIVIIKNSLWLIPYSANMILRMDLNSLEIEQIKCENQRVNKLLQEDIVFEGVSLAGEKLYLVPANYNAIVEVELQTETFSWIEISEPVYSNFIFDVMRNTADLDYNYISDSLCLDDFCDLVQMRNKALHDEKKLHYSGMVQNLDKNCGQIIYDYVCNKYMEEI